MRPAPGIETSAFAVATDAEFHVLPAAPVMLATFETATVSFTRYNVPVSLLRPVADAVFFMVSEVNVATGFEPSSAVTAALAKDALVVESLNVATTTNV